MAPTALVYLIEQDACFVVRDSGGQQLAYVYFEDEPGRRSVALVARSRALSLTEANGFFWAKIAAFVMVGLLSIIPTIQIIRWRRGLTVDAAFLPAVSDIVGVRLYLWAEVAFFAFIPAFAAAMAQGYGAFAH